MAVWVNMGAGREPAELEPDRYDVDRALLEPLHEERVRAWVPRYSPWRHGGWYVANLHYASGAVGCVTRNFSDRKWRIACDDRPGSFPGGTDDHTYANRDEAARAEAVLVLAEGGRISD